MADSEVTFEQARRQVLDFMAARDWSEFHTPKNLAMALAVEAAEIVEIYQWMTPGESLSTADDADLRQSVADEIADVAVYLTVLADAAGVDIPTAVTSKMDRNEGRFPVDDAAGTAPGHKAT